MMKNLLLASLLCLAMMKTCSAQQSVTGVFTITAIPLMTWGPATVNGQTVCTPSATQLCAIPYVTGTPETITLNVTGGTAPYTWAVSAGSLPTGLTLGTSTTATNTLSGTITGSCPASGSCFTISVTDNSPTAQVITFPGPNVPAVATLANPNFVKPTSKIGK